MTEEKHEYSMLFIVALVEGLLLALMIVASVILLIHQVDLYNVTNHLSAVTACHGQQTAQWIQRS